MPDFTDTKSRKISFVLGLIDTEQAGIKMIIAPTKKHLFKLSNSKTFMENSIEKVDFHLNNGHDTKQLKILEKFTVGREKLFNDIEKFQKFNKIEYHWEYRNYNHLWRTIIIRARESIEKYINANPQIYKFEINFLNGDSTLQEVINIIRNIKLIQNTIRFIESTINKFNFYQKIEIVHIESVKQVDLRINTLETINKIYNYRHLMTQSSFELERGIRIEFDDLNNSYHAYVEIYKRGSKVRFSNNQILTSRESFEKKYVSSKTNKFDYQRVHVPKTPENCKYIYPFYNVGNVEYHAKILVNKLKDEVNYNLNFIHKNNIRSYYNRVEHIRDSMIETKSFLENVLRPFLPYELDNLFLQYLNSLSNGSKLFFNPWCRYNYHEFELINCFEQHYKSINRLIEILSKLLEIKTSTCIKYYSTHFDDLFQKIDSSFATKMMEDLGIIKNNNYALRKTEVSAFRGFTEALFEKKLIKHDVSYAIKVILSNFNQQRKSIPRTTKTSELYKIKATEYLSKYFQSDERNNIEFVTNLNKQQIKGKIGENKIDSAIKDILDFAKNTNNEHYDKIIILSSKFKDNRDKKLLGVVPDTSIEDTKIKKSLLDLIDMM